MALVADVTAVSLGQQRWTAMDSAIRDEESEILFGKERELKKREDGELETLSGFNHKVSAMTTEYSQEGDPATDDDLLRQIFHKYYTHHISEEEKEKNPSAKGFKVLEHDYARSASKEVVQRFEHLSEEQAEQYLAANFEKIWEHFDVNGENFIRLDEAANFEKSLLGSFSITYS